MSPCLNDNWPQGRGGLRTAPPGQSNRSSHSRIVGASLPDYGPIQAMEPRAPAAPNAPLVSVAIPPIPGSMAVVVAHCVRRCGRRFRGRAVDVTRTVFGPGVPVQQVVRDPGLVFGDLTPVSHRMDGHIDPYVDTVLLHENLPGGNRRQDRRLFLATHQKT